MTMTITQIAIPRISSRPTSDPRGYHRRSYKLPYWRKLKRLGPRR